MDFIQHIPQAMLQSLGFMALLFLLFEGIRFLKNPTSNQTYWIAIVFYSVAFIHFVVELFVTTNTGIPKIIIPISEASQVQWFTYIGLLYLIMVTVYVVNFIVQWTKLVQLKSTTNFKTSHPIAQWLKNEFQNIQSTRKIQLGFSHHSNGPVTFGWMEPIIIMPFAILNQLSTQEIKFILMHEMAHIIRHDFLVHFVIEIVQLILCFNPFSYYFSSVIQLEREKACDEWVVANTKSPLPYTKALYQLATFNYRNGNKLSLAAVEKGSALLSRIQHINGLTPTLKSAKSSLIKCFIGLSFASLLLLNLDKQSTKTLANSSIRPSVRPSVRLTGNIYIHSAKFNQSNSINIKQDIATVTMKSEAKIKSIVVLNTNQQIGIDTAYKDLVRSTIAWIKAREGNKVEDAVFANYLTNEDPYEYTVAEQLILRAVLHNYALKRTILAHKITKANNQEAALTLIKDSKEWKALQQYEQWASRFLQQHPNKEDTALNVNDF